MTGCRDTAAAADRVYTACDPCRRRKRKCDGKGPSCSPCLARGDTCKWVLRRKPFSDKHYNKSYVENLERKVQRLSALLERPGIPATSEQNDFLAARGPAVCHSDSARSDRALKDLASLNWRFPVSLGEEELLFAGPGKFTTPLSSSLARFSTLAEKPPELTSDEVLILIEKFGHELELKNRMTEFFLESINVHYQFVEPTWLLNCSDFPHNGPNLQLLYSAIFAVSAYCLHLSRDLQNALLVYTESLVMSCFMSEACLPVMKAISILAWFKQTLLSRSDGFAYQYMALGLSPNLKLDNSPSSFPATGDKSEQNYVDRVKAFWSLFILERTSTPGLGLPQTIPWDYNQAPFSAYLFSGLNDCSTLYFQHHCRLLQLHHIFIETCYMPAFSSLAVKDQEAQLQRASEALSAFRQNTNDCDHIAESSRCSTLRTILWISYHAAIINLHRPFLNCSWAYQVDSMTTPLEAVTTASDSVSELLERLGTGTEAQNLPPFAIYHVLRAALVQCLNMTASDKRTQSAAKERLQICLAALSKMKETWKVPGEACINFLLYVGQSWRVTL